ncbi:hypothetical protein F5B22DRAFT_658031 [Xylaria bambusicola]|uniref:uncharacterized protein n=1 Tax=Xylaria bambusicola TaxID=326684 RepID=UPI002007ACFD|nr:uncharacterized protein F5B22DRAFT_658031 [Xylaria bambusicola]KAI0509484.1 hypothetical protein F5B22DRAFT_658031 [Xylaria bambusicola]
MSNMEFIDPQLISDSPVTPSPSQMGEEQAEFSFTDFPFHYDYTNNGMPQYYSPYAEPYPSGPLEPNYQPGYFLDPQLPNYPPFAASEYPYYSQYVSAATQTDIEAPLSPVQDVDLKSDGVLRSTYSLRNRVVHVSLSSRVAREQEKSRAKAAREKALRKSRFRAHLSSPSFFQPEQLTSPLSIMSRTMPSFTPVDLESFVSRGADGRITRGKISRPLNPFMLYRVAYGKAAYCLLPVSQNAQVSRIVGASWKMEDVSVRRYFSELAAREKENHRRLFPRYKYSFRKTDNVKARSPLPKFEEADGSYGTDSTDGADSDEGSEYEDCIVARSC